VNALRYFFQALLYVPFVAAIGYFSTSPAYVHLAPDQALIRLSVRHAGNRVRECRERTAEELAKLPPNMRAPLDCPRERAPVSIELEIDGELAYASVAQPSGLRRDLPSTVYWRHPVAAGTHRIRARLKDTVSGDFGYAHEETVRLAPGRALVIDFSAERGFVFHA
jgi:hypothetical protein